MPRFIAVLRKANREQDKQTPWFTSEIKSVLAEQESLYKKWKSRRVEKAVKMKLSELSGACKKTIGPAKMWEESTGGENSGEKQGIMFY